MPRCGSQIILCDLPVRFDTYTGCSHACKYCFVTRKIDISKIEKGESPQSLRNWIAGSRTYETKWCNWNIPLHWGGMSDPFQPIERDMKISLECLKIFAETGYPCVLSTKGTVLLGSDEYLAVLAQCNIVVQVSLVSSIMDKLEPGAPSFEQRLSDIARISKAAKRVIVRIQPYIREAKRDILNNLSRYRDAGVYGITIEGIKYFRARQGFIKCGADYVYPIGVLKRDYEQIKAKCAETGIHFFCAENRLRGMGEDLCCCGVAGLDGFEVNTANLIYLLNEGKIEYNNFMKSRESCSDCFKAIAQDTVAASVFRNNTYETIMNLFAKDSKILKNFK